MRVPSFVARLLLLVALAFACVASASASASGTVGEERLARELHRLRTDPQVKADASSIIDTLVKGEFKGLTWDRLANFTDTIGPRVCGSEQLEKGVQFMIQRLQEDGLDNVHAEETRLPYWRRGVESAMMLAPRSAKVQILGLGGSVGTLRYGPNGITRQVLVVASFDELTARAQEAEGKIIVFNPYCDWVAKPLACYGETVVYRSRGAQAAAAVGGVAALIRSVASFSINSPHTGMMGGYGNGKQIPTAAISIEDAAMFSRMQARGQEIVIHLQMEAQMVSNDAIGHNVIAEITGSEKPEEVVVVSGHLDSWDVGQGAMDDGGGAFISWSVLSVLRALKLRPKRTIRLVMWSCEEMGGVGARQYFEQHKHEAVNMSLAMESDLGVFKPRGLEFTGSPSATALMTEVGKLLAPLDATAVVDGGEGVDIAPWMDVGVPAASLKNDNEKYFWYHHSHGDTMSVLDPAEVDACAAVWAVHAYTVANMDYLLPRN